MGAVIFGFAVTITYSYMQNLPGVRGVEMPESRYAYFTVAAISLGQWASILHRERQLGGLPAPNRRPPSAAGVLGGWYLASFLITFVGGAALAVAMYLTTSSRTFAWTWLAILGWGAICCTTILVWTVRRRGRGEDAASIAVDKELRLQDRWLLPPAVFPVVSLIDPLFSHRSPPGFTWWMVGYAALAAATAVLAYRRDARRPALPPGIYGTDETTSVPNQTYNP
ncbi:hypothetical protein [Amycolatopsis sp. WAC 01376]|uniref:hypothetical protein n=1 Tax=Amycolatopsis sp. WAC 01376 TaxID=2203195 RepID=UPI0013157EA8|nr:hypothetical protein [Amycolatopsis sp. WAC 01376]